jgi:2-succinyl-6-hydroxy-2,4-cyclohexadiene-1-carboxylate synthase
MYVSTAVMIFAVAPALVLLHGFTHTGRSWDGVVAALGERYRPIVPDIRGHGSAGDAVPVTLRSVIEDVERLEPGAFTLAGYSMGGRIALHFALAWPERVERLILIGASPGIAEAAEREARRRADERLADEIDGQTVEQFAERWARTPVLAGQAPEVAARAHIDRLRNKTRGLAAALRGLGTGALPPVWDRLGELPMPVILVVGQRDQKFLAIAEQMAAAIHDVRIEVVPNAGHAVHLEAPASVAEALGGAGARADTR